MKKKYLFQFIENGNKLIYTIGYEKKTISSFLETIKMSDVKRIVDVRRITSSKKIHFSKDVLQKILKRNNIEYIHIPLFSPPLIILKKYKEKGMKKSDFTDFKNDFIGYLRKNEKRIRKISNNIREGDCLMCYERDFKQCHRNIVCNFFLKNVDIIHL